MKRTEIPLILDGTHPTAGRPVAIALQAVIVTSGVTIALETEPHLPAWADSSLIWVHLFVLLVFTAEYLTRLICARHPLRYALSFWGIIDLLACLPLLAFVAPQLAALRTLRLLRLVAMLKLLNTNKAWKRLEIALHRTRDELIMFAFLALIILYIAAVGIYIFENEAQPEVFSSITMSLWWAIVSFTTVGYGEMYPITAGGRIFTSAVLFVGLGVIAVPTALITSALIHTDISDKLQKDLGADMKDEIEHKIRDEMKPLTRKRIRRR